MLGTHIDRLWAIWQERRRESMGSGYDAAFLPTSAGPTGHNVGDGMFPWAVTAGDVLDYPSLGYFYPVGGACPKVCDEIIGRVPADVIANAVTRPHTIAGWNQLANPGIPESPNNTRRRSLTPRNLGVSFNPLGNSVVYKVGCP